jgi:long-chain acyl-CoA synthetase
MSPSTLPALFYEAIRRWNKPAQLRVKRDGAWLAISSAECQRAVEELALGLRGLGLGAGDALALLSENRPEWAYVDFATLCLGARDVPIYTTLTPDQIRYILSDSGARIAVVSSALQAAKLAPLRAQLPKLTHVVCMAEGVPDTLPLSELRARGRAALAAEPDAVRRAGDAVRPEDLATIIYTSGTTGDPKGVMLTHRWPATT